MKSRLLSLTAKIIATVFLLNGSLLFYAAFAGDSTTLSLTISGSLSFSILDAEGDEVASPGVTMAGINFNNDEDLTAEGTLGTLTEMLVVTNPTANKGWTLAVAATDGATAVWERTGGGATFDYNDGASGDDNNDGVTDDDLVGGQLTIEPSGGIIEGTGSSTNTGITLGSDVAFKEGTVASVDIATAADLGETQAEAPGQWIIRDVGLSQIVPAGTPAGTYTLGLTLTLS